MQYYLLLEMGLCNAHESYYMLSRVEGVVFLLAGDWTEHRGYSYGMQSLGEGVVFLQAADADEVGVVDFCETQEH